MKKYLTPKIIKREMEVSCYLQPLSPVYGGGDDGEAGDGWAKERYDEIFETPEFFGGSVDQEQQDFSGSLWNNM